MKTISRDNTHKKNIIKNINNTIGIPSSYAAKLVDNLISILILNLLKTNGFSACGQFTSVPMKDDGFLRHDGVGTRFVGGGGGVAIGTTHAGLPITQ